MWSKDMASEPNSVAIEEWRQLQTIIGRYDGLDVTIRGWLLALLGGLLAAFFAKGSHIHWSLLYFVWFAAEIAFILIEGYSRAIKRVATDRSGEVEQSLREPPFFYYGPLIHERLSEGSLGWRDIVSEALEVQVWIFYAAVALVGCVIGWFYRT
jgi:hypothetical protein